MNLFFVTHNHEYAIDTFFAACEGYPNIIDFMVMDPDRFALDGYEDGLEIEPIPESIVKHINMEALFEEFNTTGDNGDFLVVKIATLEERAECWNNRTVPKYS